MVMDKVMMLLMLMGQQLKILQYMRTVHMLATHSTPNRQVNFQMVLFSYICRVLLTLKGVLDLELISLELFYLKLVAMELISSRHAIALFYGVENLLKSVPASFS